MEKSEQTISGEDHRASVERFNATDDLTTLGHSYLGHFEQTACTHATKAAVICGEETLVYKDLHARAHRYASCLIQRGIRRGDLIGVVLDRSCDLVAVLLAVWTAGAAFVPIDPAFPAERIRQMLDDGQPRLVVVSGATKTAVSFWEGEMLDIGAGKPSTEIIQTNGTTPSPGDIEEASLAYVIYTSGSTGRPKGVEVSHGALSNLLFSMRREPGCSETDRFLAITTICFDIALVELLLPLLVGATTIIAPAHVTRDPAALLGLMHSQNVTMMQGTPVVWQMLLDAGWRGDPQLGEILCGGDALPRPLAQRLLACAGEVWNVYGPTEATVWASLWRVCKDEPIIIGKPISNYQLYVLDEDLGLAPSGSEGELYIGGAGLAIGYRNQPEMTQSRFVASPFGRLYRTGDLARFESPGRLYVLGRADLQVKVRGYRIELGDIEAAIMDHSSVSEAVVISRDDRLVAYCVPSSDHSCGSTISNILRPWLSKRLPSYMIPAFFVEMLSFPLTINKKIDRKALPDPTEAFETHDPMGKTVDGLTSTISLIWARVLGHDHVGLQDNFFQIGGDSARLVRVHKALETVLDRPVPLPKLFEHYTIDALAAYLTNNEKARLMTNGFDQRDREPDEGIAIVSMACRLPGNITNPEEYNDLLARGIDATTEVPKNRWDADALYDPDADALGKSYCRRGGFLPDIETFHADVFGISPREARAMAPEQRVMLQTCWEGLERAGYTAEQLRRHQTGVYIGVSSMPAHTASTAPPLEALDGYAATGSAPSTLSGRVSYVLGLEGPSMTIDTACSSSLVATHLACNALRQGECDMAMAGAISLLSPGMFVEFSRLRAMSADGRCRAFAADTQGTGWAEGCTVVLLKRLSDALRDGDTIHAVLRGTAVNHGGRSAAGLTVPSGPAQQKLIRTALAASRLAPGDVDYVETHGTGTKLGDPIEGTALADVFRGRPVEAGPLWIGSVKSNLGHTQAAAGMAGLIKVVLGLQSSTLPQTLHANEPTRLVDWKSANMELVQAPQPWLRQNGRLRRAGISAFGIGGTNAHVILEEPPEQDTGMSVDDELKRDSLPLEKLFLLSAQTVEALRQQAVRLRDHIQAPRNGATDRLEDVAYSLATTRTHFQKRVALTARDKESLLAQLSAIPSQITSHRQANGSRRLGMLFTGQGSQVVQMGKDLYDALPTFRDALDKIVAHFTELEMPLLEMMHAAPGTKAATRLMERTDVAQPALFALEVALWRLWSSWGVQPDLVLGHSIGELSAAHVAGVFSLADACRLVMARGRLMQAVTRRGSMVSLEASAAEVNIGIKQLRLGAKIDISGYNTQTQTTVSGDVEAVEALANYFAAQSRKTKLLRVSHAFHSFHMEDMLAAFGSVAKTVRFQPPRILYVSGQTGQLAEEGQLERPEYWTEQARRAVRFVDGIQTMRRLGADVFLELGAQPVLAGLGVACLEADEADEALSWLPSLVPGRDSMTTMQRSAAALHRLRFNVDWTAYYASYGRFRRVELPTYAFDGSQSAPGRQMDVNGDKNGVGPKLASPSTQQQAQAEGVNDISRLQFRVIWEQAPIGNSVLEGGSWGLLCPPSSQGTSLSTSPWASWAGEIEKALLQAGVTLRLVNHIQDAENMNGLLCLWPSDTDMDHDLSSVPDQARNLTREALTQLQMAAKMEFAPPLVWVTREAVGTTNNGTAVSGEADKLDSRGMKGLGASPLWGLMRTARSEHPNLRLRLVDVPEENDAETFSSVLASALTLSAEPECAVRHRNVLVPRMKPVKTAPEAIKTSGQQKERLLRSGPEGTVLITGGLGDLGRCVALWMAQVHKARHVVLTSRRGAATPGADEVVAELAALGAKCTVISCDVADMDNLQQAMAMFRKGEQTVLRGIVHTSGVQDNGVLSALTPQRCSTVFAPKVDGAWNLHQVTQTMDLDLDFFVLFSSISGVLGLPGLGNYAAANTFLDALAHFRRARHLPATSIAYGTWEGGGMASRIVHSTMSQISQLGLDMLAPQDGLALLAKAVHDDAAFTVAAALDPKRLQSYYADHEGIPPFMTSLVGRSDTQATRNRDIRTALDQASPDNHQEIVLSMAREAMAKSLGYSQPEELDTEQSLQNMGVDSLAAVMVRNQLSSLTGLKLNARLVLQHPNIRALSQFLLSELLLANKPGHSHNNNNTASPPVPSQSGPRLNMEAIKVGCLDPDFTFSNVHDTAIMPPRSVFVTGATGFVGAFILHELLDLGVEAYCLVRASSADKAGRRLLETLAAYGLWKPVYASLLHPIVGDMTVPMFGMSSAEFDHLANATDAICHAGGLVDWTRPLADYIGPNLVSVHEVLRLASSGRAKTVHHISTMSTIPKYMGYEVKEVDQEYGYATSKYLAEQLVVAARWRGARASIYRLPFVTASFSGGYFRRDQGDFLHNLIAGCLEMGAFPSVNAQLGAVLPVDYLSRTIGAIMVHQAEWTGRDYDFVHTRPPTCNDFFRQLGAAAGTGQGMLLPFGRWRDRAAAYATIHRTSPLARIMTILDEVTDDAGAAALVTGPHAGERAFREPEYPVPPIDEDFARKYVRRIKAARQVEAVGRPMLLPTTVTQTVSA